MVMFFLVCACVCVLTFKCRLNEITCNVFAAILLFRWILIQMEVNHGECKLTKNVCAKALRYNENWHSVCSPLNFSHNNFICYFDDAIRSACTYTHTHVRTHWLTVCSLLKCCCVCSTQSARRGMREKAA